MLNARAFGARWWAWARARSPDPERWAWAPSAKYQCIFLILGKMYRNLINIKNFKFYKIPIFTQKLDLFWFKEFKHKMVTLSQNRQILCLRKPSNSWTLLSWREVNARRSSASKKWAQSVSFSPNVSASAERQFSTVRRACSSLVIIRDTTF